MRVFTNCHFQAVVTDGRAELKSPAREFFISTENTSLLGDTTSSCFNAFLIDWYCALIFKKIIILMNPANRTIFQVHIWILEACLLFNFLNVFRLKCQRMSMSPTLRVLMEITFYYELEFVISTITQKLLIRIINASWVWWLNFNIVYIVRLTLRC